MHPILFQFTLPFSLPLIGNSVTIYTYGFLTACGLLLGYLLAYYRLRRTRFPATVLSDTLFYCIIVGYLCARITYVLVNFRYYADAPGNIFKIWEGGIVFYGGMIGAIVTAIVYLRIKKMPVLEISDRIIPGLPLGHSLGRLGCLMYGCCYGKVCRTGGIHFPRWPHNDGAPAFLQHFNSNLIPPDSMQSLAVYPTQIISAVALVIITGTLIIYDRFARKTNGETFFLYLTIYPLFRFIIEFYRAYDPEFYLFQNLTLSQMISLVIFICGTSGFIYIKRKPAISDNETTSQ